MPTATSPTTRKRRCSLSIGATSHTTEAPELEEPETPAGNEPLADLVIDALGREADLFVGIDTAGFAEVLGRVVAVLAAHPSRTIEPSRRYATALVRAGMSATARAFGGAGDAPLDPEPADRRFGDPSWASNPWFFWIQQLYLAWARYAHELVDVAALDVRAAGKAHFATGLLVDAASPTNFLGTNPTALRKAFETGGLSVLGGLANLLHDLATNGGRPKQVDASGFRVGANLAATPGKVVFRNDLMELIQYAPATPTTFEIPLLCSPPWINKYYIMDLAPSRSFVEWAVSKGHIVFAISYRNPDESMRGVTLDDYLLHGPYDALDVIAEITGSTQVNIVGLCLGGTLTTMLLAHLAEGQRDRVRSATLLNTLVDFREPGPMGRFIDRGSVERLSRKMERRGYMDATEMSTMFDMLRGRDLIWNYVESGWLMGQAPPAFDILVWNADGTRMPADMHAFYLRYCYVENQLARGEMTLAGTRLHLDGITADTYILSAKEDHIAPWTSAYAATQLLGGEARFVLSSSGHIAGIVNPPGSKRRYWVNEDIPTDPCAWLAGATERPGSWWEDWADWIGERAGARRPPPPMGSAAHPALDDAPGVFVHQK